jgi:hypothetical protein
MYQVHVVNKNNHMVLLNSIPFNTKREAEQLMESIASLRDTHLFLLNTLSLPSHTSVTNDEMEIIYEPLNGPYQKEDTEDKLLNILEENNLTLHEGDMEGLKIILCGRGLFVQAPKDHKDYGVKYYHNGWWMANGWFFKKQFYQGLINQGAIPKQEVIDELGYPDRQPLTNHNEENNVYDNYNDNGNNNDTITNNTLDGCNVDKYKNSLFVKCPCHHKDYGVKYYHNGWWNQAKEGWIFKICEYQNLIDMGAKPTKRLLSYKFLNMTYSIYDKEHYLLECFRNSKYFKQKNFEGGLWNEQAEGWLFPMTDYNEEFFKKNLAFYYFDDKSFFEGCVIRKIGRTYTLYPPRTFKYNGVSLLIDQRKNIIGVLNSYQYGWNLSNDLSYYLERGARLDN